MVMEIPSTVDEGVSLGSESADAQLESKREGRGLEVRKEGPRHEVPRQGERSPHFKRDIRRSPGLAGREIRLLREIE